MKFQLRRDLLGKLHHRQILNNNRVHTSLGNRRKAPARIGQFGVEHQRVISQIAAYAALVQRFHGLR